MYVRNTVTKQHTIALVYNVLLMLISDIILYLYNERFLIRRLKYCDIQSHHRRTQRDIFKTRLCERLVKDHSLIISGNDHKVDPRNLQTWKDSQIAGVWQRLDVTEDRVTLHVGMTIRCG